MKNINESFELSVVLLIIKAFNYSPFPLKVKAGEPGELIH